MAWPGEALVFVLGAPRSGTTLLLRLLHAHPDLTGIAEPHVVPPVAHLGPWAQVDRAPYDPIRSAQGLDAFLAGLDGGEQVWLRAARAYTDTLYGAALARAGGGHLVDKTPHNTMCGPFLDRLYPESKRIVLTRHPLAIFASWARTFFADDWQAAHAHERFLERWVPVVAATVRSGSALHLRYEDLVTDPEAACRRLCHHLELPWSPRMLDYDRVPLNGGLGDPVGVPRHTRPTPAFVDDWTNAVAERPDRIALLESMIRRLQDEDLAAFGTSRAQIWEPLGRTTPSAARPRVSRHHLERHLLIAARRGVGRYRSVARTLDRVRFMCDVLLREST